MTNTKPMSLEDMVPDEATVRLFVNDKLRDYELKRISLDDQMWIARHIDNALLETGDPEAYSKIIFRLLKDKSDFLPMDIQDYDDDGEPVSIRLKGYERVMRSISGAKHLSEVSEAIAKVFGVSLPDAPPKEDDASKKKARPKIKK